MWQRFSEAARRVVFYAQEEAQKFGEGYVSTEHLLLGLLRVESTATAVLANLHVSHQRIRKEVESQLPAGSARPSQDMMLTPRAKRVIDMSYEEARRLGNNYIGTEHLLLGLIAERDGLAGVVLTRLKLTLEATREEVAKVQTDAGQRTDSTLSNPMPSVPGKSNPRPMQYILSALLAIRQQLALPDLLVLAILAERPGDLCAKLSTLGHTVEAIESRIESEILANGMEEVDGGARLCELLNGSTSGTTALFLTVATHPSSYTKKALDALKISQESLQIALAA